MFRLVCLEEAVSSIGLNACGRTVHPVMLGAFNEITAHAATFAQQEMSHSFSGEDGSVSIWPDAIT